MDPLFAGGLIENYVMCELTAYGHPGQGFWTSGNAAEVDFLIASELGVIPIEVKSSDRYRAASLKEYMDRYSPKRAIVLSGKDHCTNGNVTTIPLYFIWMVRDVIRNTSYQ